MTAPLREHARRLIRFRQTWFGVRGRPVRLEIGAAAHPGVGFRISEHCEGVTVRVRLGVGFYFSVEGPGRSPDRETGIEIYFMPDERALIARGDLLSEAGGEWPGKRSFYVNMLDVLFGELVVEDRIIIDAPGTLLPLPEGPVKLDGFRVSECWWRRRRVPYGVPVLTGRSFLVHWEREAGLGMPRKMRDCQGSAAPLRDAPRGWGRPCVPHSGLRSQALAQIAADVVEARVRRTGGVHRVDLD